jgi:asparagine synthase (glutamine-hydrolysing)
VCGIAGIVGQANYEGVASALRTIQSRGPDGSSVIQLEGAALGQARLAIIDLSDAGRQPFTSGCGRYVITFNGEIYNFQDIRKQLGNALSWRSESDTEVLLNAYIAWGSDALQKLHGMFAFAVWDKHERSLFIARDRMGVKPCYYHHEGNTFAFASRPRAIFEMLPTLSRDIDQQALRYYLEAGYVPGPHSIYRTIRKLPPAHYLIVQDGNVEMTCYWSSARTKIDTTLERRDERSMLEELDEIVNRSVRLRMVSDVPIGVFLSGGIDSSLVAAYVCKNADTMVQTFTIGFDDPRYDESNHAAAVAKHLGTRHHQQLLTPNDLLNLMPTYMQEYDEPFFDYSAFPTMAVSKFARAHVKVSLSADGGDEIFGGYHYYRIAQRLEAIYSIPASLRSSAGRMLGAFSSHNARLLASAINKPNGIAAFAFMRGVIKDNHAIMSADLYNNTKSLASLFETRAAAFAEGLSAAERAMRLDCAFTLADDYLQKVDVASMAFSLEAREPLLDHALVEWGTRLPLSWKIRGATNKYLLRQLAYRHIPREIIDRPKQGFGLPMGSWLRQELKSWADDLLQDKDTIGSLGINNDKVQDLWREHLTEKRDHHTILWTILVLLQFAQNYQLT